MKNKLSDLNNHLFAELERLGDEDLKGEELWEEFGRAKSLTCEVDKIVQNGELTETGIAIVKVLGRIKEAERKKRNDR